jgi:hypothetical protein
VILWIAIEESYMATQISRRTAYGLSDPLINVGQEPIISKRNPLATDRAQLGTEWVNTLTNNAFFITSVEDNIATWVPISGAVPSITFDTDIGSAVTSGGTIDMAGGNNITTSGSGSTVTYSVSGTTNHAVQIGNSGGSLSSIAVGTNGQVLIGASAAAPAFATLTSTGGTIAFSIGANTLNLEATAVSFTWTEVTGTTQAMAVNNGYITNNAGLVTATLPATAALGAIVRVTGKGAGGWKIAQNAGQIINLGTSTTTTGTGGFLASTNTFDSVELVCITANTTFNVISSIGNITVV